MSKKESNRLFTTGGLIWRGMSMGIAEVIPGVSGGTLAFITGIYKRLILSIKAMTGIIANPKMLLKPKELWHYIDGKFLFSIFMGMIIGMLIGLFGVTYFLENYPEPLWAFFFGLILASVFYLLSKNKPSDLINYIGIILGAIIAYALVQIVPAQGTTSLPIIFIAGMIAICALVLPGISGSFMLLLMGLYSVVIPAVKDVISFQDLSKFPLVITFALGCLLGISLFSRILNWLLDHQQKLTMSVLIGFMIGSLAKLWPWRNPISVMDKDSSKISSLSSETFDVNQLHNMRILVEENVLPSNYWGEGHVMAVILCFLFGLIVVFGLSKIESNS